MKQEKFLVIRRDNIGDLICTLPLLRAIRQQRPDARLIVLANSYNAPVLNGNPDINAVFSYQKAKHLDVGEGRFSTLWQRLKMTMQLRGEHFDWIVLPGGYQSSSERFAKLIGARNVARLAADDYSPELHEVELACRLLPKIGLDYQTPNAIIYPDDKEVAKIIPLLSKGKRFIAIHISARKISQRWSAENFVQLIQQLNDQDPEISFLLLWAPGNDADPKHPGDDAKAQSIITATRSLPVVPFATKSLEALIAVLSRAETVVCCDGGAMHIAAGLAKPIVCLFGESDAVRWRPWGTRHELLQTSERNVDAISVATVVSAYQRLR